MPRACVGTSGWSYEHWKGAFYDEGASSGGYLQAYAGRLSSVEVNGFFYGLPEKESVRTWRETVPDDFVFAVKASRYLTHMKKLKDPEDPVATLMDVAREFGDKLGPVLLQLPPHWKPNPERLYAALDAFPQDVRLAVEFRDTRWISGEVREVLRERGAAFCVYELAGYRTRWHLTADFGYVRMHGPAEEKYKGRYSKGQLRTIAGHLREWLDGGRDVYCYFDNDEKGFAALNAMELADMLQG